MSYGLPSAVLCPALVSELLDNVTLEQPDHGEVRAAEQQEPPGVHSGLASLVGSGGICCTQAFNVFPPVCAESGPPASRGSLAVAQCVPTHICLVRLSSACQLGEAFRGLAPLLAWDSLWV